MAILWLLLLLLPAPPRFASAGLLPRSRRSLCQEGNYTEEGRTCCRCGAGQYVVKHCEVTAEDTVCDHCEAGQTFNSHANGLSTCEPCTSCSHPSTFLEVKEECTIGKDTVCRCLKDHYCIGPACRHCDPCDTCEETAVKTPCWGTNNTVCQEKNEGHTAVVIGSVVGVLLIALLVFVAVSWKKGLLCFRQTKRTVAAVAQNGNAQEMEELLKDLSLNIPAVAAAVGWRVMRDIALETGTTKVTIDNCLKDNPGDTQEQTVQLLLHWVQAHGAKASNVLVDELRNDRQKKAIMENVLRILRTDGQSSAN